MKKYLAGKLLMMSVIFVLLSGCNRKSVPKGSDPELEAIHNFGFVKADNLTEVIDFANAEGKLVFLDVYTDWCLPCKMMDEDVFSDADLGSYYKENFIAYKVNAEQGTGPEIAALYQVPGYPTLLYLDGKGRVLAKKIGVAYHNEMYDLAKTAIAKAGLEGS